MKVFKTMCALLFASAITASAQLNEVSGFQNPESVVAYGDKLFVSNMGAQLDPTAKDGDGYITMLWRKDGKMGEEKFISGLNSPKGMIAGMGKLVVTDVDKIVVFNIKTRKKIWEFDLSKQGITYANDLVKVCGGALVSSTDKNAIYKVCMNGKVKLVKVKVELPGANGLTRKCSKLYVANFGRNNVANGSFGKVNRCSKKYTEYQSGGAYDGIVKIGKRLIVSDWVSTTENAGRIVIYNVCKKKATTLNIGRTINGPADLFADCKTKTLWIPAMREGKILAVPYDMLKQ